MKPVLSILLLLAAFSCRLSARPVLHQGAWRAYLQREDGQQIVFNFSLSQQNGQPVLTVLNAAERLQVTDVRITADSVLIEMPFFESAFRIRIVAPDSLEGSWIKGTPGKSRRMPFFATARNAERFAAARGKALASIDGKWSVTLDAGNGKTIPAIAVFTQRGSRLSGSILTPSGDYRYLEGLVTGDSLVMSTFDGSHAFLFTAGIRDHEHIVNGNFYSGPGSTETWTAVKNDTATLPDLSAMYVKPGEPGKPAFSFKDLNGYNVSLSDERFRNKVVVLQLMGSWCPNCMDETAFLSEWYRKNRQRGVEIIGLAYEYSTNFERAQKGLRSFQQRFNVEYPLLITGVTVMDSLRTEKTLPQFTPIKSFPTSLVLDKQGTVRKIDTGFFGPGTGEYYTRYCREFEATIDKLLKE